MYDSPALYDLTQTLSGAIFGAMAAAQQRAGHWPPEIPDLLRLRRGRAESPGWFLVQALEFDPEPISVAKLRIRDIYASEGIVFALLALMASEKWLEPVNKDEYLLSDEGRALAEGRVDRMREAIASLEQELDLSLLGRLESLLEWIISASMACDDPPGNWCLRYSRNRAPGPNSSPLVKINQYMADFNAFRDDAHMAAWRPQGVSGYTWEAFAFVCDGSADTALNIDRALHYRGYSTGEYAAALDSLVQRGWLEDVLGDPGRYRPTDVGSDVRQEVERLTNRYFYEPWKQLGNDEQTETVNLMNRLRQELGVIP